MLGLCNEQADKSSSANTLVYFHDMQAHLFCALASHLTSKELGMEAISSGKMAYVITEPSV